MPLVRIDLIQHRSQAETKLVADAIHEALVHVLGIPPRDRFQIITTHSPENVIAQDAGLKFERSRQVVMLQIFTQAGRSSEVKQQLFAELASRLAEIGIAGEDLFVGIVENSPNDWSFGFGRAQYLTGDLQVPALTSQGAAAL